MDDLERFQDFLKAQGQKLTQQRETILRRIEQMEEHFSADDLYEVLRKERKGISKATVYRTLALLVEAKLLDALDFERGHLLYERAHGGGEHHDHLVCIRCRRILEFHNEDIERLQEEVAKRYDFHMISHTHHIYGLCGRCQRKERGRDLSSEEVDRPRVRPSRRSRPVTN